MLCYFTYFFLFIYSFAYLFIHLYYVILQKGTPWECGLSLHSATTDTAHVPWFSHCFGFSAMAKQNQNQKNKKTRKKTNKQKG